MRVFLTGASGFVGRSLVNLLGAEAEKNDFLLTTSSRNAVSTSPHLRHVRWDVSETLNSDVEFDILVHAACARAGPPCAPGDSIRDQIVRGAENVVELCALQKKTPFVVYISSGAVYGEMKPGQMSWFENSPRSLECLPDNGYTAGKIAAEELFTSAARKGVLKLCVARLFTFSGSSLMSHPNLAITSFVRDARKGGPIRLHSSGECWRSYLHEADLARWLRRVLVVRPEEIVHIGSPDGLRIIDLADAVAEVASSVLGFSCRVLLPEVPVVSLGRCRYVPSTAHTQKLLSVSVDVSLEDGIREMLVRGGTSDS